MNADTIEADLKAVERGIHLDRPVGERHIEIEAFLALGRLRDAVALLRMVLPK